jgi:hypothetical protein
MNRRNVVGLLVSFLSALIGLRSLAFGRMVESGQNGESRKSLHAEAIALVMESQREEIAKAELQYFKEKGTDWFKGGAEQYWWHDTIQRYWYAGRPFAPGVIDSTHFFLVSYSIGGNVIARWSVDTRKRTAQRVPNDTVM